jgi:hypothetical protein
VAWSDRPGLQFKKGTVEPPSFTIYTILEIEPLTNNLVYARL